MAHPFYTFAKNTDSVPQNFAHGGTTGKQIFQQNTTVFWLQEQFTVQRRKLHEGCHVHLFHSYFTHGEFHSHAIFNRSLVPLKRLSDTWRCAVPQWSKRSAVHDKRRDIYQHNTTQARHLLPDHYTNKTFITIPQHKQDIYYHATTQTRHLLPQHKATKHKRQDS